MRCAISGEVARDPVVCSKSGHVFERSLLEKHLERAGTDPVSGEDASVDDIIAIKGVNPVVMPRSSQSSLPGLISAMQNEWDALMLETYSLKQQLHTTRQELSHALYQYDAATRVIARLTEERDQARALLSSASAPASAPAPDPQPHAEDVEMSSEEVACEKERRDFCDGVSVMISEKLTELSATRKQKFRNPPEELVTAEVLAGFVEVSSHTLHLDDKPGILCVDSHSAIPELVATGGRDSRVCVFNADTHEEITTLYGHDRAISSVAFHATEQLIASGSDDGSVRVWSRGQFPSYKERAITYFDKEVTSVSMHPCPTLMGATSADGSWQLFDFNRGKIVHRFTSDNVESYACGSFHPDGRLFGAGDSDGVLHMWDTIGQVSAMTFDGHKGKLASLSFSANGYFVASGDDQGNLKLWDLRKHKSIVDMKFDDAVSCVRFDHSGHYLGVSSANTITLYKTDKKLPLLSTIEAHDKCITGVAFGMNAQFLASVSLDRNLKFYKSPE